MLVMLYDYVNKLYVMSQITNEGLPAIVPLYVKLYYMK